jgi:hypothetical protein
MQIADLKNIIKKIKFQIPDIKKRRYTNKIFNLKILYKRLFA